MVYRISPREASKGWVRWVFLVMCVACWTLILVIGTWLEYFEVLAAGISMPSSESRSRCFACDAARRSHIPRIAFRDRYDVWSITFSIRFFFLSIFRRPSSSFFLLLMA